jgi:1-pyrroline-5-carboxylate dehydrogenase
MLPPYRPEPYVDFAEQVPRARMLDALGQVGRQLGRNYPLRIGGKEVMTEGRIASICPANKDQVVGYAAKASPQQAEEAIQIASQTFTTWSRVAPEARARILIKAAAIIRRRIYEMSAWMCYEVSKNWAEAYADVCETIDFLEFYGREMIRLGGAQPTTPYPGEENEVRYIPLGVCVVIPPWNFPMAICAGMTSAAIVAGNTVVLKPASASPVIAAKLAEVFQEAGLPEGVLNFLPGSGGAVGDLLVDHPTTRLIAFTGSKEVGLRIFERASKIAPGQIWLKRTVLEMGGKDCIVVDETADLDAAAQQTVAAAFGFQGQKCSACSRLIVHEKVYPELVDRVVELSRKLTIGNPAAGENYSLGAVIDEKAYNSIRQYIDVGRREGRLLLGDTKAPESGYFLPPTIFGEVDRQARIAQEEIFGPVLAITKGRDFDELLDIANGTEYGLTGALFSRDRLRIERARHELHVGNLYINRKCTGAIVDVQPFGGFNMSGTDSKAGGRDYLQLFMQAKSICERF